MAEKVYSPTVKDLKHVYAPLVLEVVAAEITQPFHEMKAGKKRLKRGIL